MKNIEKIIFLDFDGVIVTPRTKFIHLDPICIKHLKHIIEETDAHIVISSVWRTLHSFLELKILFEPFGMFNRVLDVTPVKDGDFVRGLEIDEWLNKPKSTKFQIKSFVILDDDSDMKPHMNRLVQTNAQEGLTAEDAEKCIKLLKSS